MQVSSHMQYNYDMSKDAKEPTGLGTCGPQASEQVAEKGKMEDQNCCAKGEG